MRRPLCFGEGSARFAKGGETKTMSLKITALLAVLAAALTLGGSAGAGTQPPKINLTDVSAVDSYLRSIGVDPAKFVKQAGLLNYAGPNCPGLGWNCTTATSVVQIAQAGGSNDVDCTGKPADTTTVTPDDPETDEQTCIIVQTAPAKGENHAKCQEKSDQAIAMQQCTIIQDNVGGGNHADINQENNTNAGDGTGTLEQDAQQFAHVMQDSEGGDNHSDIHQSVNQSLTAGDTQTQEGHQVAFVEQSVTGSSNFSHVHQSQDQSESGGAGTQSQNTGVAPTITVGTMQFNFDCGDDKVAEPNQCANVFQDGTGAIAAGANNESHLHQAIGERQTSTFGTTTTPATQTQGRPDGGQEGDVHQQNPEGFGLNHDVAHQDLGQRQSSTTGNAYQNQLTDPGCCGVGTQLGGAKNREDINQATTQSSSEDGFQQASLFGQVHQVNDPDNSCRIDQHGRNNSDAGHFSADGEGVECANLFLTTECTSTSEGGSCGPPICVECEFLSFPTTATFGRDIAMPDYNAEPADYTP
jgi:hypothetical protein